MEEQRGCSRILPTAHSQAPSPCPEPIFLCKEFRGADVHFLKRFRKVQVLQHSPSVGILGSDFPTPSTCSHSSPPTPNSAALEPCSGSKWQFRNQPSIKFSCCGTSAFAARFGERRANDSKLQSAPKFQSALSSGERGQSERTALQL